MVLAPRLNFNAPLEPVDRILHGAGQDFDTWISYSSFMESSGLKPEMFMAYVGLGGLTVERLRNFRKYWETDTNNPPLMQLGLSMTHDGKPEKCYADKVARGECDDNIRILGEFFERENQPVLMRIGYECTGPWNGYEPVSYVEAFQRVTTILREFSFPLATVWCVEGGWTQTAAPYHPGKDFVDWYSVDLFSPDHFEKSEAFMKNSLQDEVPVLIGECTPRRVGVLDGEASWNAWFKPFFEWINRYPNVKGISYINWEWSGYEMWKDWGDARLQMNPFVLEQWKAYIAECVCPAVKA
jgi:hypothetical protein